jgi:hypothetical protein
MQCQLDRLIGFAVSQNSFYRGIRRPYNVRPGFFCFSEKFLMAAPVPDS